MKEVGADRSYEGKTGVVYAKTLQELIILCGVGYIHAGRRPVTKTGDYSDVKVIDAEKNEFAWPDVSHISDDEMKVLMKGIVNRLYTFMMQGDDPRFDKNMNFHKLFTRKWDAPEIDPKHDCTRECPIFCV